MKRNILLLAGLGLAALAAAQVRLPQYTRQVLPNGVVLDLMPRKDVPLITLRAVVKGGAESDPGEMAGLAAVTAELLRRGTATRSSDQFSEDLDSLGATFQAGVNEQSTWIQSEFLSRNLDRGLELFAEAIVKPAFPEPEVKKALAQRIDASRSQKDMPPAAIPLYFRSFFYGPDHPYGRPSAGDEVTLAGVSRKHIADYHARTYVGGNMIIIAAGDFDPAALAPKLAGAFGPVAAGTAYVWKKDSPPARGASARLLLVDKPDATQTYFMIGQPGIHRTHPDRVPLWLVNTLFGGRFTSMLNDQLRVTSGLTYGAGSFVEESRLTGAIVLNTYTPLATTEKAIDMALDVQKRLYEKGITADQLASAKAYVKGTFPMRALETTDQLAAMLGQMELFGLGRGEVDDLFARIDSVTLERANAVAKKYYEPANLCFTLLGNASKIRAIAAKYAPKVEEVPITKAGFRVR